jgi:calpain-15
MPLSFRNLYKNGQGLLDTAASHDGHVIPYVLALFAAKVVEWQEQVSTKPGFLAESLFLLARKIGKKDRALNNITSYQVQLEPSCYYYIVENHNSNSHLTIELDVSSCINVLSSRNDFFIRDSIPPNHRQVVMVLSPLIVDNGSIWVQFAMKHILQPLNINGLWGSYHYPELTDSNRELHLSRPMF